MGLSGGFSTHIISEEEGIKLIRDAIAMGVNFFDTSDAYGPYHNEKLLGVC